MLRNYLLTAIRFFWRHKGYTFLNILGLTVGLTTAILILLWIQDELKIDQSHPNPGQLYHAQLNDYFSGGNTVTGDALPYPIGEVLINEYPEVKEVCFYSWHEEVLVSIEEQKIYREAGRYTDPNLIPLLGFKLLAGHPNGLLQTPHSIAISSELASRLFGPDWERQELMGQLIHINQEEQAYSLSGVFEKDPHSSFTEDFYLPMENFVKKNDWLHHWGNRGLRLLVKLNPGVELGAFQAKASQAIKNHYEGASSEIVFQPWSENYLYGDWENGVQAGGRIDYVYLFALVACFLVIIAVINFMNLSTARASRRAKEIGVRKTTGASRTTLIRQFIGESILMALLAGSLAGLVTELMLPLFNQVSGRLIAYPAPLG